MWIKMKEQKLRSLILDVWKFNSLIKKITFYMRKTNKQVFCRVIFGRRVTYQAKQEVSTSIGWIKMGLMNGWKVDFLKR